MPREPRQRTGRLIRPSVFIGRWRSKTSVSLEPIMWEALSEIATQQGKTVDQLVTEIDRDRTFGLSGAIRIYIVEYYRARLRLV